MLLLRTRKLTQSFLLLGLITGSFTSTIVPSYAVTFAKAQGSLHFTNFSHFPDDISSFRSAFAYVATEQGLSVAMTEPQFVTGTPLLLNPLATRFPVIDRPLPGGGAAIAPLNFDPVTGSVAGSARVTFAESQAELLAVNLGSESQLSGGDAHLVATVGQSGFSSSFLIGANETFSVDWQSALDLAASTSNLPSEAVEVQERHVAYFSARPADLELNDAVLMFSLFPQTRLSASDPRIDVGVLEIVGNSTAEESSHRITDNGSSPDSEFQIEEHQARSASGSLTYAADDPTILTVTAYTSSAAYTAANPEKPVSVSEPTGPVSLLIAIGIGLLSRKGERS